MLEQDLQKLVETISKTYFYKPFLHRASFNSRLRTTGGRYLLRTHNIEINRKYFEQLGEKELVGIIKHELCHYHLHIEGRGYKHRDRDFKDLLERVGAPRFCNSLPEQKKKMGKILLYRCTQCEQEYVRKRSVDTSRYVCGKCKGKLVRLEVDTSK